MKQKEFRSEEFTTEVGNKIERFVNDDRTVIVDNLKDAINLARQKMSYYYPLFVNFKHTGLYGVPS
jgi:hypothetical protein